jgi:outer membrane protein insertion porin family
MRKIAFVMCFLFFSICCVFSQNSGEWFIGKPIKDITFKGLDTVSLNELNGIMQPYRGKAFTYETFEALQRSLYDLDYFEIIIPNAIPGDTAYESVIIECTVTEHPVVGEIRFQGNKKVRSGDLLDVVLIKNGDMINMTKVRIDEEAIRGLYLEKGFPEIEVKSLVETDPENNRQIVIFEIVEGNQTSIRTIRFSGNSAFSESALKSDMESKEQSLFNSGIFTEQKFQQDLRLIENFYRERGYIDARIVNVIRETERNDEENRTYLILTIYVREGLQYQYGGITFEGNNLFTTERLNSLLRVKPADGPINLVRVDADFQRVADLYYENGYIFNAINREEIRDEVGRTVSYIVRIVERSRAHIENIIIRGNQKTKDFVLEREITLEPGDVFSKTKIIESLMNLQNLQYFAAVTPETPQGSADGLMDLIFNVEESSTADIMFGLAFGGNADFPVSANVRWTDRNFLGNGQTFSIDVTASPVMQSLTFNFLEKWLLGERWSGGMDFTIRHSESSGIPQDILWPMFNGNKPGENAFPDPFTGEYVYSSNGKPWEGGPPTAEQIGRYGLVTDYEYAGGTTAAVPNQYKMTYEAYDFSVGLNTGYRFPISLGVLGTGVGVRTTLTFIDYDDELHRPYLATDRENHGTWMFTNSLSTSLSLDKRDFYFNPTTGYYLSQVVRFVGGPLRGERHYIKTDSKIENFNTLINWEVTDTWSYRLILGLHSALSFIMPTFWTPAGYDRLTAGTADLLWIDGMYIARGWGRELDKRVIWDNWVELRMPLSEKIIWFDLFFDMVGRWNTPSEFGDFHIQDFLFGYGAGFRFSIPQFPIRFYVAKRFRVTDTGGVEFQRGSLFRDSAGLDFVFSIGYEIFNQ